MRNEADRLPGTLPGLFAAGAAQLVFLDDESTDGSAGSSGRAAADRPAGATPSVTVLDGRAATGRLDREDLGLRPARRPHRRRTAGLLRCGRRTRGGRDHGRRRRDGTGSRRTCSRCFPRERTGQLGGAVAGPADRRRGAVLPALRAAARARAVRRDGLRGAARISAGRVRQRSAGFAAVRTELVEDVAVARLSRRHGLRLGLALGGDQLAVRMCDGYRGVIDNLGRGLTATAGGSRGLVIAGFAWHLLAYTLPLALIGRSRWWRVAALLAVMERLLVEVQDRWPGLAGGHGGRRFPGGRAARRRAGDAPAADLARGGCTDERSVAAPPQLPSPSTRPPFGHLSRWTSDGLGLLEEGARLGPVFGLRLWRRAVVGYSPDWNRFVLGDLQRSAAAAASASSRRICPPGSSQPMRPSTGVGGRWSTRPSTARK